MLVAVMYWDYIIILLILGVVVPWRSRVRLRMLLESQPSTANQRVGIYVSTIVFQWATFAIILWRLVTRGESLPAIGFAFPYLARSLIATTFVSVLLVLNQIFSVKRLSTLPAHKRGIVWRLAVALLPRTKTERWIALALVTTVALCEEFIYRGFIEQVFQQAFSSVLLAAGISAAFFALAHLYQGARGFVATFVIGILLSGVRVWTGSLVPSVVIHFAVDLSAGLAFLRTISLRKMEA